MASDDTDEHPVTDDGSRRIDGDGDSPGDGVAGAAVDEVDQRIVDLLSWILDTETRAKIYVYLLAHPGSTSEEVAQGTGLYPSTVREALAELHDEERVSREKRASEGAGNNPYEYTAIQPSELVGGVVDQVQHELNTIFTLDRLLDRDYADDLEDDGVEPVTITVADEDDEPSDENEPDPSDVVPGHDGVSDDLEVEDEPDDRDEDDEFRSA